jgi:glucose-6-phosphate 1-dehydrogenase
MDKNKIEPHVFIIFGATGDLSQRSIIPALYNLAKSGKIAGKSIILGTARTNINDQGFRDFARKALANANITLDDKMNRWIEESFYYQTIGEEKHEHFAILSETIKTLERDFKLPGNRIFYLATPPMAFPHTIEKLGDVGLAKSIGWTRIVIEKPFGRDLESAGSLNDLLHRKFDEPQIYRIDHYLGKETVQNLLVFRFANPIFESLWNRDRIHSVQITVAEDIGIGSRAGYYDRAGALRDMVQNHLTQLITLVAMEVPVAFDADSIRTEKLKVLKAIPPVGEDQVVFGQYVSGEISGQKAKGYLEEEGVRPDSRTETFVAMALDIADWRWHGVPFYLRTGKRLPSRSTRITINFRRAPVSVFDPIGRCDLNFNSLNMILQPDEGFDLCFEMKDLGEPMKLRTQSLHFRYAEALGPIPDAYETLILDTIVGDQTLFVSSDWVEASWKLYTPLLERQLPVYPYPVGTWGPKQAEQLIKREGHAWANH